MSDTRNVNLPPGNNGTGQPNAELQPGQRSRLSRCVVVDRFRYSLCDRVVNLLCVFAFWVLLLVDIFGVCCWLGSQIGLRLIAMGWLRAERALGFELVLGALMTPVFLTAFISWVFRGGNAVKPK